MNKKGFTLIELIAVVAVLSILMLLVVPNLIRNYNDSKKEVFHDNVVRIYDSAESTYVSSGGKSGNYNSDDNKLNSSISKNIKYEVDISEDGKITKIFVTDGSYTFSKEDSNGLTKSDLTKEDIKDGDS